MAAHRTSRFNRAPRGAAVFAVALAIVAGALTAPPPVYATDTPTDGQSATAAATWLAGRLKDGRYFEAEVITGFDPDTGTPITELRPDPGLTIDAVLALAAAGDAGSVKHILDWLTGPGVIEQYVGLTPPVNPWDPPAGYHAGELAKVILALEVAGRSTVVHGVDLVQQLRGLARPAGDEHAGLFINPATEDDTNTFDQSLAILALARTPDGVPPGAVDFLLSIECTTGEGLKTFPGDYKTIQPPWPGSPSSCDHVDSTGIAVQALLAAGRGDLATPAVRWLLAVQTADGGFFDTDPAANPTSGGINSNSTGLAGQALHAYCQDVAGDRAAAYIKSLQVGLDGPAEQRGGIAYNAVDPDEIFNPTGFQWASAPRATTQAILALTDVAMGGVAVAGVHAGLSQVDCPTVPAAPTPDAGLAPETLPATGTDAGTIALSGAALLMTGIGLLVGLALRRRQLVARAGRR